MSPNTHILATFVVSSGYDPVITKVDVNKVHEKLVFFWETDIGRYYIVRHQHIFMFKVSVVRHFLARVLINFEIRPVSYTTPIRFVSDDYYY